MSISKKSNSNNVNILKKNTYGPVTVEVTEQKYLWAGGEFLVNISKKGKFEQIKITYHDENDRLSTLSDVLEGIRRLSDGEIVDFDGFD